MARRNQSPVKDYSGWRLSKTVNEPGIGRVTKSSPDTQGILDDIRRQPINRSANKYKKSY